MNKDKDNKIRNDNLGFAPEKWSSLIEAGCYSYVLNLKINEFFLVGDFIGRRCTFKESKEVLIGILKEELRFIFKYEVKEIETDKVVEENERKIYLLRDRISGYYHFFREDSDRGWSHKNPQELPKQEYLKGQPIQDPKQLTSSSIEGWCFLLKQRESE